MTWTRFMDMHSGGRQKEKWAYIYIEAPEDEAKVIFYNRFGHNPERVTCTCCGDDYSISSEKSLEQLSAYDRHCDFVYFRPDGSECEKSEGWVSGKGMKKGYTCRYVERQSPREEKYGHKYITLNEYKKKKEIFIIPAKNIKPAERKGEVPTQGYVWQD